MQICTLVFRAATQQSFLQPELLCQLGPSRLRDTDVTPRPTECLNQQQRGVTAGQELAGVMFSMLLSNCMSTLSFVRACLVCEGLLSSR